MCGGVCRPFSMHVVGRVGVGVGAVSAVDCVWSVLQGFLLIVYHTRTLHLAPSAFRLITTCARAHTPCSHSHPPTPAQPSFFIITPFFPKKVNSLPSARTHSHPHPPTHQQTCTTHAPASFNRSTACLIAPVWREA